MEAEFPKFVKTALQKAKAMGADQAEAVVIKYRSLELQLKSGTVDEIKQADSQGIGLRVLKGQRQGFSFSSDFRATALDKMVSQAITNSHYNDVEQDLYFPAPKGNYPQLHLYDSTLAQHTLEEKAALAQEAERQAAQWDSRVFAIERSGYEESEQEFWLGNSNGLMQHQNSTYCGLLCQALGEQEGEQQSGYGLQAGISFQELSPQQVGQMAGKCAVQLLGAAQIDSGVMDLVLEPMVAMRMMGIISSCFSGEAVRKNKSFLAGQLGQMVASPEVTLIDDGCLDGHLGSAVFDGEGTPTQKTVLVENGMLQHYLYDCLSAAKAGTASTGNGMRSSYRTTPRVGTTSYYLAGGRYTPAQLLQAVENGIYVTDILGAHTANPVSGDFSFGASGILIEHGQLTRPVRGVTIAGNFQQLLKKIHGVGNDVAFYGAHGAPTVRIEGISVSGR